MMIDWLTSIYLSIYLVVLNKRVSDIDTSGLQESENHATAKDELVDLLHT